MRTRDAPSHSRYSIFRCEEARVIDVNRSTYTLKVETRHSAKTVEDIQALSPYHHYANGEGIHHLPEVGAVCILAWPNDNTSPFVLGYLGMPAVITGDESTRPAGTDAEETAGSTSDVTFRSRRPPLNPGDIGITGRDENFLIMRRGGVLQLGATSVCQRLYLPVLNYIKDFAENYELSTFGGQASWTVGRVENDPGGKAPATYTMYLNEFAQDAQASVRVRYLGVPDPGEDKIAWEVDIAPQGIDPDDGSVTAARYSLKIMMDGTKTEIISASRTTEIDGNDDLRITGARSVSITGDDTLTTSGKLEYVASREAILGGAIVKLGSAAASKPAVLGPELLQVLSTLVLPVSGAAAGPPNPATIAQFQNLLSTKVFLE